MTTLFLMVKFLILLIIVVKILFLLPFLALVAMLLLIIFMIILVVVVNFFVKFVILISIKITNASLHFDFSCPYCGKPLSTKKERKHFIVHRCRNPKCSFYLNNLNSLSEQDLEEYKSNPERFKLHYIYREFKNRLF